MQARFNALILAGHDPDKPDPLARNEGSSHKALIEVGGRPMIWHVVQALHHCPRIDQVAIVGLDADCGVVFDHPVHFLENQGSLFANAMHGLEYYASHDDPDKAICVVTGDAPLLTWEAVTYFLDACRPADQDLYWGIIRSETMEAVFPGSRRTYLRTMQGRFCSADLFLARFAAAQRVQSKFRAFTENRKNLFIQARIVGFGWLVRLLIGRIHLDELVAALRRIAPGTGRMVIIPFAGPGMDVDKPHQLALVRAFMAARQADAARRAGARSVGPE